NYVQNICFSCGLSAGAFDHFKFHTDPMTKEKCGSGMIQTGDQYCWYLFYHHKHLVKKYLGSEGHQTLPSRFKKKRNSSSGRTSASSGLLCSFVRVNIKKNVAIHNLSELGPSGTPDERVFQASRDRSSGRPVVIVRDQMIKREPMTLSPKKGKTPP
ncbi:hypothetical protein VP01_11157g1, partial [Puccinia sorghi]